LQEKKKIGAIGGHREKKKKRGKAFSHPQSSNLAIPVTRGGEKGGGKKKERGRKEGFPCSFFFSIHNQKEEKRKGGTKETPLIQFMKK